MYLTAWLLVSTAWLLCLLLLIAMVTAISSMVNSIVIRWTARVPPAAVRVLVPVLRARQVAQRSVGPEDRPEPRLGHISHTVIHITHEL